MGKRQSRILIIINTWGLTPPFFALRASFYKIFNLFLMANPNKITQYLEINHVDSLDYVSQSIFPNEDIYLELHFKLIEAYINSLQNQLADLRYKDYEQVL
jgi:predicted histidine transporter YuiF (NhaC family)